MKVAYFVNEFPSLSETFILNQITGLLARGHEVHIYGRKPSASTAEHNEVKKYRLTEKTRYLPDLPKAKLRRVQRALHIASSSNGPGLATYLKALRFWKYGRIAANLRLWYAVSVFGDSPISYDVIHAHFGPRGTLAVALRDLGVISGAVVTTFHGADMSRYLERAGREYSLLAQRGDLFLPISVRWKQKLLEMGFPERRTKVHHMGVDTKEIEFQPPQTEEQTVHILSVARLTEKKGIEYGIRAFSQCRERLDIDVKYTIVGDGPRRKSLERLVTHLNLAEDVRFAGWQSKDEVYDFLQRANLFLAPSVTAESGDKEGIPVAIMEAMASGIPVVSTVHSGIPELVDDGKSGLLVPEGDVEALADALCELSQAPDQLTEMASRGRKIVQSEFDTDVLNDQLVEHYRTALSWYISPSSV